MLQKIAQNIDKYSDKVAFVIEGCSYSFRELKAKIIGIQALITDQKPKPQIIGLVTFNNLETYAAILACWFSGYGYLPVNPKNPFEKNQKIIDAANIEVLLSSERSKIPFQNVVEIVTTNRTTNANEIEVVNVPEHFIRYLLFTSGSTGEPKGVPINKKNLDAFVENFNDLKMEVSPESKFLQMFELTFDLSVFCFLYPLLYGASIHTINSNKVKYIEALKVLRDQTISHAFFVPSTISFLQPYFNKIRLEHLNYCLFSGEALPVNIFQKWQQCVPNCKNISLYGPSENTIDCSYIDLTENPIKSYNEIVSIGKPFGDTKFLVLNSNKEKVKTGEKGELYISGNQVFDGYYKLPHLTKKAFIEFQHEKYYKSGDLAFEDINGFYYFVGRADNQIQIQGFRVELEEIEAFAKESFPESNFMAIALEAKSTGHYLVLVYNSKQIDENKCLQVLKQKLAYYMVPQKLVFVPEFPVNSNGKLDRKKLKMWVYEQEKL